MKKWITFLVLIPLIFINGCNHCDNDYDDDNLHHDQNGTNKILMLKLDYITYNLEGYKEFQFDQNRDSCHIIVNSGDEFGYRYIQLIYKELNQQLFYGLEYWDGPGGIVFPESFSSPDDLESIDGNDVVFPTNGFNNIFPYFRPDIPVFNVWLNIQHLQTVREYLNENPTQKVEMLFFRQEIDGADETKWSYIVFLKN